MSPPSWPHHCRVPQRHLPQHDNEGVAYPPLLNLFGPGGKEMKERTIKKWITRQLYDVRRAARRVCDSHLWSWQS